MKIESAKRYRESGRDSERERTRREERAGATARERERANATGRESGRDSEREPRVVRVTKVRCKSGQAYAAGGGE